MFLDFDENTKQILIKEESPYESLITLQESTGYRLCFNLRKGVYRVPYIAYPIITKIIRLNDYAMHISDKLKNFHKNFVANRKYLSTLKEQNYSDIQGCEEIALFIREQEELIRKKCKNFNGFYGNQIDSIIYGIIGKRVVIANDIGTGKTLVSIMIAKYLMAHGAGRCIIMLPASLSLNFYNDYCKFFDDGQMMRIGTESASRRQDLYQMFKTCKRLKFLITNYEKCRNDYKLLEEQNFDIVIVDEFHKMKNFKDAQMSKNFFNLVQTVWKPSYVFPMSGTPIENRLFDIYPVFKLIDDGMILGGERFFECNFVEYQTRCFRIPTRFGVKVVEKQIPVGFKNHKYVKSLIAPYVIRKKLDLPAGLYRHDVMIDPDKKFMAEYERVKFSYEEGTKRYHAVRQFLCDTSREGYDDNPKFEYLENIVSQTSSKVVIFSFYKCSIHAIEKWLVEHGYKCITCMGGDGTDAFDVIRRFKDDPDMKCLITTDKINYGHNIQFAKIVIEWEKPIKPTTSMQRIGRCYRSGQNDDVHAYSFTTLGTVEQTIHEQLELKKDVIEKVIESLSDGSSDTALDLIVKDIEKKVVDSLK